MGGYLLRPDCIAQAAIDLVSVPAAGAGLVQVAPVNGCGRLRPLGLGVLLPGFVDGHD